MVRLLIYFILAGLAALSLYFIMKPLSVNPKNRAGKRDSVPRKVFSSDNWIQVYETASWEEAQMIQLRLKEEGIDCIIYQQGKKDIHGNPLRGFGIACPKTSLAFAQRIISRIPA